MTTPDWRRIRIGTAWRPPSKSPGRPGPDADAPAHARAERAGEDVASLILVNAGQTGDESFIITSPLTIRSAAAIRIAFACSPRTKMPTRNAPTAPIPVQIV